MPIPMTVPPTQEELRTLAIMKSDLFAGRDLLAVNALREYVERQIAIENAIVHGLNELFNKQQSNIF